MSRWPWPERGRVGLVEVHIEQSTGVVCRVVHDDRHGPAPDSVVPSQRMVVEQIDHRHQHVLGALLALGPHIAAGRLWS